MSNLKEQLIKLGSDNKSLRPHIRPILAELKEAGGRKARLGDGPVGSVLDKYWDMLHDLEHDLQEAAKSYNFASSYVEKGGKNDAEEVLKKVKEVKGAVEKVSMKLFRELFEAEEKFTKEHGHPSEYVEKVRNEMYSR